MSRYLIKLHINELHIESYHIYRDNILIYFFKEFIIKVCLIKYNKISFTLDKAFKISKKENYFCPK